METDRASLSPVPGGEPLRSGTPESGLSPNLPLFRTLTRTALAAMAGMTAYEAVKVALFPGVTVWQSHAMTMAVSGVVSTLIAYLVLRQTIRVVGACLRGDF